jgi:hypothetical protein
MDPITAAIGIGSSLIGGIMSGSAARKARRRQRSLQSQIRKLEASRQEITDPYEGVKDMLTNPFANLTVATQAAEMQAQQTDLSLASALDTLRATGSGAGGATALAQAALSAKQGVSASIAQQEARNEQLRAQGEANLQRQLADAESKGKAFVFGATERREMQRLNRLSSQAGAASQQAAAAGSTANQMFGQALGGVAGAALTGGFSGNNNSTIDNTSTTNNSSTANITGNLSSGINTGVNLSNIEIPQTGNIGSSYNFGGAVNMQGIGLNLN